MRIIYTLFVLYLLATACQDPRKDQRDDNIFDPANAFVRFDYENQLIGTAQDTVSIAPDRSADLLIPVALSAPAQSNDVRLRFRVRASSGLVAGTHYELLNELGESFSETLIVLPPGDFDHTLIYRPLATAPNSGESLTLELTEVDPNTINLGFPGSGRGSTFEITIQ